MNAPSDKAAFIEQNGYYVSTPQGSSMKPFIRGGRDTVILAPVTEEPERYDVVLYVNGAGEHVLHRIVRKKNGAFLVRGDHCYYNEYVKREQMIGVLERIVRDGTTVIDVKTDRRRAFAVRLWVWLYPARKIINYLRRAAAKLIRPAGKKK